jgi:pimeloyl-ACP methyl ester carboxylesterase
VKNLTALLAATLFAMTIPGAPAAAAEDREVSIDGGKAPLQGSLMLPDARSTGVAVLMVSGSGPTDRNGDSAAPGVKPHTQKLLADGLAGEGIASLRFDKRGIGASAPAMTSEAGLTFTTMIDDVVAWAQFLARQPGVSCVVIAGHSEGSQLAIEAARKTPVCGLVLISGAGRSAADLLKEQLSAQPLPDALRSEAFADIDQLRAGRKVEQVSPQLMALFRPSIQPYMISWLALDPAADLAKVKAPVLIIQGETDIQVDVADAKLLAKARPDGQLLLLDGVNHVLKRAPADRAANFVTYGDPSLPLDPRVVPAVAAFVKAQGRR